MMTRLKPSPGRTTVIAIVIVVCVLAAILIPLWQRGALSQPVNSRRNSSAMRLAAGNVVPNASCAIHTPTVSKSLSKNIVAENDQILALVPLGSRSLIPTVTATGDITLYRNVACVNETTGACASNSQDCNGLKPVTNLTITGLQITPTYKWAASPWGITTSTTVPSIIL